MVDFSKFLDEKTKARLHHHDEDVKKAEYLSDQELGAVLIHYYHNMEVCRFRKGEPVYDAKVYWVFIPEIINRLYEGKAPTHCPCEGCTCSDWRR